LHYLGDFDQFVLLVLLPPFANLAKELIKGLVEEGIGDTSRVVFITK
jgi:hypothetical protein